MNNRFIYFLEQMTNLTMRVRYTWGCMYIVVYVVKCISYYEINNFKNIAKLSVR